ncbi:MAG: hypothetical protein AB7G75_08825 [Candidatus Binatia bacterium]
MTLTATKTGACLLLVFLRTTADMATSIWGLVLLAVNYTLFSFVPWLAA